MGIMHDTIKAFSLKVVEVFLMLYISTDSYRNVKVMILCLDMELSKLDEKLVQILAWQRLQQLLPSKPNSPQTPNKKGVLNGLLNQAGQKTSKYQTLTFSN